uniref:Shootin-1 n=1 Tax=Elaeophora elaphi TaxID=1147741 RepID=A0A0R3RZI5_9BILA
MGWDVMTSTSSTRSTFSGLSDCCLSEAGSSGLENRTNAEESQEDCPRCVAMRLNTIIAEEALASLSGQFKNLQKELKKTEQVSKINEEQAKYIDERRSKLEKLEAEHTSLYAEYENLRISHDSLKRQYDEVVATARRNQRLIDESVKYHETCKVAMENLMAEKEARQELLAKYLKSVEAASKINDSMKQLEKKCVQLQAVNEKLEPFKYHCPSMLRLLLEFGEIIENNGLMTKSLQNRLARYKDRDDLREYLLRKTRRLTNLSESSTKTIEESSDDDELAKGVEDLLLSIDNPPRLRSPKKSLPAKEEIKSIEKNNGSSITSVKEVLNVKATEKGNFLRKQLESVEARRVSVLKTQSNSDVHMEKTKTCKRQLELIEKQKKETLCTNVKEKEGNFREPFGILCVICIEVSSAVVNKELIKKDMQQAEDELQIRRDVYESSLKSAEEKNSVNTSEVKTSDRNSERKQFCENTERLSTWLSFAYLDPLLPEISRPTFLDTGTSEVSRQLGSDDYVDNLFGPLSPSISSRRTSASSIEGCVIPKNKINSRSEMTSVAILTKKETSVLDESLSLAPVPESSTNSPMTAVSASAAFNDSGSLCCVSSSAPITETVTVIQDEQAGVESVQNFSNEITKKLSTESHVSRVRQTSRPITTNSNCVMPLRLQRKPSGANLQNEDERSEIGEGSPKLPKIIITKYTVTKEDELEDNQGSMIQRSGSEKMISERVAFSRKKCLGEEENLVRLPEDKVKTTLEMFRDKSAELETIQDKQRFEKCIDNPILEEQSLRRSLRRRARIDSWSSADNQKLMMDTKKLIGAQNDLGKEVILTQQENVNTKLGKVVGNQMSNDDIATQRLLEKEASNLAASWRKDGRNLSKDEESLTKHDVPGTAKSGNQIAKEKHDSIQSVTTRERDVILRIGMENSEIAVESSSEDVQIRESKKLGMTRDNKQVASNTRKRKLVKEEVSSVENKWGDTDQTAASSQKSKMIRSHHAKERVNKDSENTDKSKTSTIKALGIELSDFDDDDVDDDKRLEIVTEDVGVSSVKTESALGDFSTNCSGSQKTKTTKVATKKSVSTVRSEMYKKMHKRLAVQTSCMKELGRVQVRKPTEKKMTSALSTSKKTELPNIAQRKRAAIMVPVGGNGLKKAKNVAVIQHDPVRVSKSSTKIPVGSDEAAVMCLFDQALSESNYNDKLLEIVQKFQTPAISAVSCEKLAEYCVKFINKLDVGNMWHSVVLAVRYWSGKQREGCTDGKVLELHQVASSKERNFIEVLHQLSGEEHWNDIISSFLRKMVTSMMKTRPVSVAQHGLNIRCVLLCTRILLQDDSNNEVLTTVTSLLQRLIERDSSDRVVPMMCYSVAIIPEIVDKLLLEKNEQYEPVRRVMSVHLASRDELFTIFSKVIMSRLLNKSTCSATCLQKLDADNFHCWFAESVGIIVMDISGLNLESMELSPTISSAMMTCYALFSLATNRLVPDKEALIFPVVNECVQIISGHFECEKKEGNEMFVDSTVLHSPLDDMLVKTMLRFLLFGRLITSFIKSTECFIFPRITNLVEEIHRLRESARRKLEQEGGTAESRLLYFGLNDWLRVVKPCTRYLHSDFT